MVIENNLVITFLLVKDNMEFIAFDIFIKKTS